MGIIGLDKTGRGMVQAMIQTGKATLRKRKVTLLADILANSMEHFNDRADFSLNLTANIIAVKNVTDLWNKYWELDALERDNPSFDWIGWIEENEFINKVA